VKEVYFFSEGSHRSGGRRLWCTCFWSQWLRLWSSHSHL